MLVSYDGEVKITDFGIAKARTNLSDTAGGVFKGKYEYMSPEQARGETAEARSDIFSTGVVLYEMLTGKRAFRSENEVATLEKVKAVRLPRPRRVNPRIPAELESICLKALAKDASDRFEAAADMHDALRTWLGVQDSETIRRQLSGLMGELFAADIAEERARLEAGRDLALRLFDSAEAEAWKTADQRTNTETLNERPAAAPADPDESSQPWLIGAVIAAVAIMTVALVLQLVPSAVRPDPGRLELHVEPAAAIWVDGVFYGKWADLEVAGLAPGKHRVKLEADGGLVHEEVVHVGSGGVLRMDRTLVAP